MDRLLRPPTRPTARSADRTRIDAGGLPADTAKTHAHPRTGPSRSTHRTPSGRRAPRRVPDQQPVRRLVTGVLLGALTMFGVATLDTFAGAEVPVLGSFAAPASPAEPEVVEVPPPPATPGTCLTWTRPDAADTAVVDCAQPHLFEQVGSVALTDQVTLPDDRQWRRLVMQRCGPVVISYLDGRFDPDGRYRVGALKPSPTKWADGDRELRCGLQSASRSGALYPTTGRVADNDQSSVYEPGTCLAIDSRTIGDPVDCTGVHAVETVGIVDLTEKFPDAFPQVGDQDAFLQPECGRIADEYAGGAEVIAAKKLTVYWDNLTEESWNAGTRKVNCNLAALLPDRSGFAPVTGPVRGDVTVGATPAPPASNPPEAGVPAPINAPPAQPQGAPPAGPPPAGSPAPAPAGPPPAAEDPPAEGSRLLPVPPGLELPPAPVDPVLPLPRGPR